MHRCFCLWEVSRCLPHSFRYETIHLAAKTRVSPRFRVAHRLCWYGEGCGCAAECRAAECRGLPTWWSWRSGPDRVNHWSKLVRFVVQQKNKDLLLMAEIREKPVEVGSLSFISLFLAVLYIPGARFLP